MKGLIIKRGNEVCKAGIPDNGVSLMVNITRYEGAYWNVGGLKMPGDVHVTWNGGTLEVGDEIRWNLRSLMRLRCLTQKKAINLC